MTCTQCGTEIAEKAVICYRCGHPTREPSVKPPASGSILARPRRRRPAMVAAVLALILLVLAFWLLVQQPWVNSQLDKSATLNAQLRHFTTPPFPVLSAEGFQGWGIAVRALTDGSALLT